MKFSALLLIVLISFTSCNSFVDKLKCIFENPKVKKSVINLLKGINAGEQPVILLYPFQIDFEDLIPRLSSVHWLHPLRIDMKFSFPFSASQARL